MGLPAGGPISMSHVTDALQYALYDYPFGSPASMIFKRAISSMSPEHEKLFSLLCVIERMANATRRQNHDQLLLTLYKIHVAAYGALEAGHGAKVSLRVRTALEGIVEFSTAGLAHNDPYKALEAVLAAAVWGSGKSKLLTAVSDRTWREQCAGRATLALRRDYPELSVN